MHYCCLKGRLSEFLRVGSTDYFKHDKRRFLCVLLVEGQRISLVGKGVIPVEVVDVGKGTVVEDEVPIIFRLLLVRLGLKKCNDNSNKNNKPLFATYLDR